MAAENAVGHEIVNELEENIVLHAYTVENPASYKFHVSNHSNEVLHFTFDFSRSTNVKIVGHDNPIKASLSMRPKSNSIELVVVPVNPALPHDMALSTGWEYEEHDPETHQEYQSNWDDTVSHMIETYLIPKTTLSDDKSRDELIAIIGNSEFIDAQFPPKNSNLYQLPTKSGRRESIKILAFRRPLQFSDFVSVFGDAIDPADIILGALPDVWLISSISNLAEFPSLIKATIPEDFRKTADVGIYKVILYRSGVKVQVVLDDYFPCYLNAGPAYSTTKSHALWLLLLEKAFAKTYGNYTTLAKGTPYEALLDLTGLPAKCIRFDDIDVKPMLKSNSLWNLLVEYQTKGFIMTVSTGLEAEESINLASGHSFTVLALHETSTGVHLVKLSNPWELTLWGGDWSATSELWTRELRSEVGATDYPPTVLWMSFKDVVTRLHCINVVMSRRKDQKFTPYVDRREKFDYNYNPSTFIPEAPMYFFKSHANSTVYFTVFQNDAHIAGEKSYIDLGVTILQKVNGELQLVGSSGNSSERQNMVAVDLKKEETYIVVPTSTGCKFKMYVNSLKAAPRPADYIRNGCLVVHSDATFDLEPTEFDHDVYNSAIVMPILSSGKSMDAVPDKVIIYSFKSGCAGVSYAAKNISRKSIQLNIDFAHNGQNIVTHKESLYTSEKLQPGEVKILHHIFPVDDRGTLNADWDCNLLGERSSPTNGSGGSGSTQKPDTPPSDNESSNIDASKLRTTSVSDGKAAPQVSSGVACKCTIM